MDHATLGIEPECDDAFPTLPCVSPAMPFLPLVNASSPSFAYKVCSPAVRNTSIIYSKNTGVEILTLQYFSQENSIMLLIVSVLFFGAVTTALPGFPPSWAPGGPPKQQNNWNLKQFNSLVTFGDSYTDESRLGYFISHNGAAPPPGTLLNQSFSTPGGGRTWDRYVIQYTVS